MNFNNVRDKNVKGCIAKLYSLSHTQATQHHIKQYPHVTIIC